MNALDLIRFSAKTLATAIVLVGFAPVIVIAWLCYFLCKEAPERQDTKPMDIQAKPVFETTSAVFGRSPLVHAS